MTQIICIKILHIWDEMCVNSSIILWKKIIYTNGRKDVFLSEPVCVHLTCAHFHELCTLLVSQWAVCRWWGLVGDKRYGLKLSSPCEHFRAAMGRKWLLTTLQGYSVKGSVRYTAVTPVSGWGQGYHASLRVWLNCAEVIVRLWTRMSWQHIFPVIERGFKKTCEINRYLHIRDKSKG